MPEVVPQEVVAEFQAILDRAYLDEFVKDYVFCPTGEGGGIDPTCSPGGQATSDADRRKQLRVPPAWRDVWLNPDASADLQATGVDSKGRRQYIYSAAHSERAAAEKFSRLKEFNQQLQGLRGKIAADLGKQGTDGEAAAVLTLIDKTGFRIGSDRETQAAAKAYGATTLTADHVKVSGGKVTFSFTGKKGVEINKTIDDAKLARILAPRVKRGGRLFGATDSQVRDYLRSRDGDFKVKDFRTWTATATALAEIKSMAAPGDDRALKRAQAEVAKRVANVLGNTPAIALKSYIDPAVWSAWKTKVGTKAAA